jgi:hypothetical protein
MKPVMGRIVISHMGLNEVLGKLDKRFCRTRKARLRGSAKARRTQAQRYGWRTVVRHIRISLDEREEFVSCCLSRKSLVKRSLSLAFDVEVVLMLFGVLFLSSHMHRYGCIYERSSNGHSE